MATLFKLEDGRVIKVEHFEVMSQHELKEEQSKLQKRAEIVGGFITPDDVPSQPVENPQPVDMPSPTPTPEVANQPVDVATPADTVPTNADTVVANDTPAEEVAPIQLQ